MNDNDCDNDNNTGQKQIIIDKYNKLQILHNIFTLFLLKSLQTTDIELKSLISSFESMESNFFLLQQPPDESMGLLFSDLLAVKSISDTQMPTNSSMKILSYFEEEIRLFLKSHRDLLSSQHQSNPNNTNEVITMPSEVLMLLLENFNCFTSIYSAYANSHTEQKQNILTSLDQEYTEINTMITSISNVILNQLCSEQHIKTLHKIKESLNEKNKKAKDDINYLSAQLVKYKEQGETMTSLVTEYNKLCNMIDCSK